METKPPNNMTQNISQDDINKTLDDILNKPAKENETQNKPTEQSNNLDFNNNFGNDELNNKKSNKKKNNTNKNVSNTSTVSNEVNTNKENEKSNAANNNTNNYKNNSVKEDPNENLNAAKSGNNETNELEQDLKEYEKIMNKGITRKIGNTISGIGNSLKNKVDDAANSLKYTLTNERTQGIMWNILLLFMLITFALIVYFGGTYLYSKYMNKNNVVNLLEGTKNSKHSMVISQNPDNTNYIGIERSKDKDGIEFSYAFWFLMDDMTYKNGEWKHIMHKGSANGYPNRCPGVWIHPDKNAIRVYLNTYSKILEFIDIDNLPIRKWIHVAITVHNKEFLTYINGYVKSKKTLDSLPRQNDGDLWINLYGGFSGYMSKIIYTPHKMSFDSINSYMREGVYGGTCIDTNEIPPYMADSWWQQLPSEK